MKTFFNYLDLQLSNQKIFVFPYVGSLFFVTLERQISKYNPCYDLMFIKSINDFVRVVIELKTKNMLDVHALQNMTITFQKSMISYEKIDD